MFRWALLATILASGASAEGVTSARYEEPTKRYAHGVLGDAVEWGALVLETDEGRTLRLRLPEDRVFEDTEPRVVDVDGDGEGEVIVVETQFDLGARLSIYDANGLVSATDHIGRTNRWLAPVGIGAADLDGDGRMEIAYVDRPHLAKTLRIFRFAPERLQPVADLEGVTNHRIGDRDIAGGFRDCGSAVEIVVASADWLRVLAVRLEGTQFEMRDLGPNTGTAFRRALDCQL